MIEYNTALPKLEMREYGRHIQKLIEHCVSIENKEERNKCAYSIAEIMVHLFPELNGEDKTSRKVWDHINLISNFKLDVDFPCDVLTQEEMKPQPGKIPYSIKSDRYRVYGTTLQRMIKEVSKLEGGLEKDQLIFLIANQMKKLLITVNSEGVTDKRIFNDIRDISGGSIDIDSESYRLNDYIGISAQHENKKKKKK